LRGEVFLDRIAEMVPIVHTIRTCRDARDDKFLELVINGEASLIITVCVDLLELDPFQGKLPSQALFAEFLGPSDGFRPVLLPS
jgi:predicted nucleic acid-binding protein